MWNNYISQDERECSQKTGIVFNVTTLFVSGIIEALDSHLCSCIHSAVEARVMWSLQNLLYTWERMRVLKANYTLVGFFNPHLRIRSLV